MFNQHMISQKVSQKAHALDTNFSNLKDRVKQVSAQSKHSMEHVRKEWLDGLSSIQDEVESISKSWRHGLEHGLASVKDQAEGLSKQASALLDDAKKNLTPMAKWVVKTTKDHPYLTAGAGVGVVAVLGAVFFVRPILRRRRAAKAECAGQA